MQLDWQPAETSTHQDAVVAHVLGATVLGYFVHDETAHLLLDIGFIWSIYLDGQMVLLPHPVTTSELHVDEIMRQEVRRDIELLLKGSDVKLERLLVPPIHAELSSVEFYEHGDQRQIRLCSDAGDLVLTTQPEQGQADIHFEVAN